ncbi:hypothetical protein [Protaetiibacter intestinalis]|uniref:Uncharacterized protein n=1 Tax=Protaetiibacter intestinalis TaxID=2419774 RepID=A0A387B7Q4_9MICO|nr:hypothetical protein [Protaetiibacter intestinalis]AYF97778.1 hypothetical protein D7I47_05590 [Protaetiibacter intestinalis]
MRIALAWAGAVLVVGGAIAGGVAVANATVFSAASFAEDYLRALAAGRVDEVLALPGVDDEGLDDALLDPAALGTFRFEVRGDTERGGVHAVRVAFGATHLDHEAVLRVERTGSRFLLFPAWGFASSPVTELELGTTGDERLTVGEVPLTIDGGEPVAFAALTPGIYRVGHDSAFLHADPTTVVATGTAQSLTVDVEPNDAFVAAVQEAMEADLDACAAQTVLFPTGCPFGWSIEDRVASEPLWTIAEMPDAEIAASDEIGLWAVPPVHGVAHLSVEVQSIFDGTISTLEEDVPFDANYLIAFDDDRVALIPGY